MREDRLPEIPDWDEHTRLANEKEILGFFITGHPLEKYRDKLEDLHALSTRSRGHESFDRKRRNPHTAGIITNLRVLKSKRVIFMPRLAGRYVRIDGDAGFS